MMVALSSIAPMRQQERTTLAPSEANRSSLSEGDAKLRGYAIANKRMLDIAYKPSQGRLCDRSDTLPAGRQAR